MVICKFTSCFSLICAASIFAQPSVLTNRYDNNRSGANLGEKILTPATVSVASFGKLFSYQVDGSVFAQPLYVPNLNIPKHGTRNVLFVCTMNDSVYAFDADRLQTLWSVNFTNGAAGITAVPIVDITGTNTGDIVGPVGIESTPVIDQATGTMYMVARTKEVTGSTTTYVQRLHAISITTGAEKFGGPVVIQGSVPGTGQASSGGMVAFDPKMQNQRAGLALATGQVVIAWAAHMDIQPYHGWVITYNAATLAQVGLFATTPNGSEGGIWQAGRAPVVDLTGNVYLFTGNGSTDQTSDFSEAALRFQTSKGFSLADYFIASDFNNLNAGDLDLSGSGPLLMPGINLLVGGGKAGALYLLVPGDLGHYTAGDKQIPQKFIVSTSMIKSGPVFWNSAASGPLIYIWGQGTNEPMKAYHFNGTTFDTTPLMQSTETVIGDPGGNLTLSANGNADASGIVWALLPDAVYGNTGLIPGVLRAFSAQNITTELWNSKQNQGRDDVGYFAKFVPPVVVNGKLYMASFSDGATPNYVNVYGPLTPSNQFQLSLASQALALAPGRSASLAATISGVAGHTFNGSVHLSVAGLPAGVQASFNPQTVTGVGSSTLTLTATSQAALGTSVLTVTGATNAHNTKSATLTLTVTDLPGAISMNIQGSGNPLLPADIAGVTPKANWNNFVGGTQSVPQPLSDEYGTATGATATWIAAAPYSLPIANTPANFTMMQGYFDNGAGADTTISVTGLTAAPNGYLVYVYADGQNAGYLRMTNYTVSGPGTTTATLLLTDSPNTDFSGTFTQVTASQSPGNYMIFKVGGTSFSLVAHPVATSGDAGRGPINGIQIVPQ